MAGLEQDEDELRDRRDNDERASTSAGNANKGKLPQNGHLVSDSDEEIHAPKKRKIDDTSSREDMEEKETRATVEKKKPVTATLIGSFGSTQYHGGITKVEDKIYILDHGPSSIKVYEDAIGFRFMTDIALSGIVYPDDIVYSNTSKCVYIGDGHNWGTGVWVMTTTVEHEQKKLFDATRPCTLSFTQEGHLLLPRKEIFSQNSLEIFSLNGNLIRRLNLLEAIQNPRHVVQTLAGNFILLHELNVAWSGKWVISQLTNDGQLIHRFIPRNKSEELLPEHLCLDSDNNRLFVADSWNHRVILFDSRDLTWSQVLLSQEKNDEKFQPYRLLYEASKKRLFVEQHKGNVTVYEIN